MDFNWRYSVVGGLAAIVLILFCAAAAWGQVVSVGTVNANANLRSGPGVTNPIVGTVVKGRLIAIAGQDASGDWLQLESGEWIVAFLVETKATLSISTPGATTQAVTAVPLTSSVHGAAAKRSANLRAGPGTNFAVIGAVSAGQPLTITGQDSAGDWLQLADDSWIAAFLVEGTPSVIDTAAAPALEAAPTPVTTPSPGSGNRFVLVEKRLWNPYENGGSLDGPSVHCGAGRKLVVNVLDANGSRVNGVAVQAQYGAREIFVTGAQGKGDGVAEFVLGGGQDVKVIRDNEGSPVSSDLASGLSTNPQAIPYEILIAGQYCQDEATCRDFSVNNGCLGHFSWTVTFQRQN